MLTLSIFTRTYPFFFYGLIPLLLGLAWFLHRFYSNRAGLSAEKQSLTLLDRVKAIFKSIVTEFRTFINSFLLAVHELSKDFLLNFIASWYIVISLVAIALLLHWTEVGKDITTYLLDDIDYNTNSKSFYNIFYITFILLACLVYAFSCWIVPRYEWFDAVKKRYSVGKIKMYDDDASRAVYRSCGTAIFYILALGIDFSCTTVLGEMTFGFVLMSFVFYLLLAYFTPNGKGRFVITGRNVFWFGICIFFAICILAIVLKEWHFVQFYRKNLIWTIELIVLATGVFFWLFTFWWENKYASYRKDYMDEDEITAFENPKSIVAHKCFYRTLLILNILALLFFTFSKTLKTIHPIFAVLLGFSFVIVFLDYFHYAFQRERFGFRQFMLNGKIAQIMVLFFSGWIFCRAVIQDYYVKPMTNAHNEIKRSEIKDGFKKWLTEGKDTAKIKNIYIVAGQGGGSRAGFWMSRSLLAMDSISNGDFRKNCFAISTASGSSVGTLAALSYWNQYPECNDEAKSNARAYGGFVFTRNYITSGVAGNFFFDLLNKFLPDGLNWDTRDRNTRLCEEESNSINRFLVEKKHTQANANIFSDAENTTYPFTNRSFLDVYYKNKQTLNTELPYFFPNTCEVNSGKRAVVSPFETNTMTNIIDVNAVHQNDRLTLGAAANLSELFPIMSAAASLDTFQYVDGGYYENYGLTTASEIYDQCQAQLVDLQLDKKIKIHLITVINSVPEQKIRTEKEILQGQYLAIPMAILNVHFGGYAESARALAKKKLGGNYHEIIFTGKVPLTRILTADNCRTMEAALEKQLTGLQTILK